MSEDAVEYEAVASEREPSASELAREALRLEGEALNHELDAAQLRRLAVAYAEKALEKAGILKKVEKLKG